MSKWALWQQIDNELGIAWEEEGLGCRARIGSHVFRLYMIDGEWVWEISDIETGSYYSGTTPSKQTALEDISFQLKLLYW